MKRNLIIGLMTVLVVGTLVFAQTINKQIYGIATPGLYKYTLSTNTTDAYLLSVPTLSTDDTIVGLAATQTLTNKTLTSPTVTGPTITGTIGGLPTITTPVIASFYQDANKTILITAPSAASVTLASLTGTETLTNKTLTTPKLTLKPGTKSFLGAHGDWTMSASEAGYFYYKLTSAAGGAAVTYGPTTSGSTFAFWNSSGQTITIKNTGQNGVALSTGYKYLVIHNGTDYVVLTKTSMG